MAATVFKDLCLLYARHRFCITEHSSVLSSVMPTIETSSRLEFPLLPADQVFPLAYGNEEETGLIDNSSGEMSEPYDFVSKFTSLLGELSPHGFVSSTGRVMHLQNAGKIYVGGTIDRSNAETNLERTTPECSSINQLITYMRSNDEFLYDMVRLYLNQTSGYTADTVKARIQKRVVDNARSRKGEHDSIGVYGPEFNNQTTAPESVLAYLACRSFVTGAGHVPSADGLRYAQKIDGLSKVRYHGYQGSLYRIATPGFGDNPGTRRFEVRCSDANISEWAIRMRIGGLAIAWALSRTPLHEELLGIDHAVVIDQAKSMNRLLLKPDGTIKGRRPIHKAIDQQAVMAETFMSKMDLYAADVPDELLAVASEIYRFCDDMKKVIDGKDTIAVLADRADWAAKFFSIQRGMRRDEQYGQRRSLNDIKSRAADMLYDAVLLESENGDVVASRFGTGYRLRDAGIFRGKTTSKYAARAAMTVAPQETRARLRSDLLRNFVVTHCDWETVTVAGVNGSITIKMPDVKQTEFSEKDQDILIESAVR
jgi:hypothetical protein